MRIKGLQIEEPGLPRAGIIRLGFKTRSCSNQSCRYALSYDERKSKTCPKCNDSLGNEYPIEAPHFIVHDAPGVAEALGTDKPTELYVFFPFNEIEKVFPSSLSLFTASCMACQSDGESIVYAVNPTTGQTVVKDGVCIRPFTEKTPEGEVINHHIGDKMPCSGINGAPLYGKCLSCSPSGLLLVQLRDAPRMTYFQISTGSIANLIDIPKQLSYVKDLIGYITGKPRLVGVPFILRRVMRSTSVQKKDKAGNPTGKMRTNKWFLQLEVEPEYMIELVKAQRQLVNPLAQLSLPATIPNPDVAPEYYADIPQWETPLDEVTDGEFEEAQPSPEPETTNGNILNGIEDLLFQLHLDFGLKEDEARARIKELGYNGLPKDESQRRQKLSEIYAAVKSDVESHKAGQIGLGLDVPAPAVKSAVQAGL